MNLLAEVERVAKRLGVWAPGPGHQPDGLLIQIGVVSGNRTVLFGHGENSCCIFYPTPSPVALLALYWHETGRTVRRLCADCEGGRQTASYQDHNVSIAETGETSLWQPMGTKALPEPETWSSFNMMDAGFSALHAHRPCPTCSAKGYLNIPLTRVVREATPREALKQRPGEFDHRVPTVWDPSLNEPGGRVTYQTKPDDTTVWVYDGDPAARTELLAAAYGLAVGWSDKELVQHRSIAMQIEPSLDPRQALELFSIEPVGAQVLRDYLATQGVRVTPERTLAITPELLADFGTQPAGWLGKLTLLWLSGELCEACRGKRVVFWDGADPSGSYRCERCAGHGTAFAAALLSRLA